MNFFKYGVSFILILTLSILTNAQEKKNEEKKKEQPRKEIAKAECEECENEIFNNLSRVKDALTNEQLSCLCVMYKWIDFDKCPEKNPTLNLKYEIKAVSGHPPIQFILKNKSDHRYSCSLLNTVRTMKNCYEETKENKNYCTEYCKKMETRGGEIGTKPELQQVSKKILESAPLYCYNTKGKCKSEKHHPEKETAMIGYCN